MVKTEYVRQQIPALPAEVEYYSIHWIRIEDSCRELAKEYPNERGPHNICVLLSGLYAIDDGSAKGLLKNVTLLKGRERELEQIIEGLR